MHLGSGMRETGVDVVELWNGADSHAKIGYGPGW